jgi:GTP pyrophosphokinase
MEADKTKITENKPVTANTPVVEETKEDEYAAYVEELHKDLIAAIDKYHPANNYDIVERAYALASKAHKHQRRKSGEPYIIHPLSVARLLAGLELDLESIAAGLLHDVVEDTEYSEEDIEREFNSDVALLVDGVTKLDKIKYTSKEEFQAENYRKMFLSMAKDIRVILIKIADRLHNMRTLQFQREEKQRDIAQETLDIYAPLADRLGISTIKTELEDLCLKYLDKEAYFDLVDKIQRKQSEREAFINKVASEIKQKCDAAGIKNCTVYGRPKHFFSIYKKMHNKNKTIDQIYDLFAVRVLVDTVPDCYGVLGIVHEAYTPMPKRFKDYIALPKSNRYQSLHNTLIGEDGTIFEIQIRTYEMHRIAEYGIAAHWKYKEGRADEKQTAEEEKIGWLRQILEWQRDMSDNHEFMDTIKMDLDAFHDNVYCFTPDGKVISLVEGSTPVDFAYAIHSAVGNKMISARVNGRIVKNDYVIQNGDRVEIVTSQNSKGPSMDWLKFVKTSQARTKINQWYKKINKEENISKGRELIDREATKKNLDINEIMIPEAVQAVLERYSFKDWASICAAVGHGGLKEGQVVNKLKEVYNAEMKKHKTAEELLKEREDELISKAAETSTLSKNKGESGIYVKGLGITDVRFSKCCSPVPGDEIVGFVTRGRGVSIHRTDCINVINLSEEERGRLLEAEWNLGDSDKSVKSYTADIKVIGMDRTHLTGDILNILYSEGVPFTKIDARTVKDKDIVNITIEIKSRNQMEIIWKKILAIPDVITIERVTT